MSICWTFCWPWFRLFGVCFFPYGILWLNPLLGNLVVFFQVPSSNPTCHLLEPHVDRLLDEPELLLTEQQRAQQATLRKAQRGSWRRVGVSELD